MEKDTVIVVGITREDEYNNLWVTSKGGGEEIKIGAKRSQLHPLFQQGKAVMLHWETYKNIAYVADAKLVEGELPPPTQPQPVVWDDVEITSRAQPPAPQEIGMWWKELGEMIRAGIVKKDTPEGLACHAKYWHQMFSVLDIKVTTKKTLTTE